MTQAALAVYSAFLVFLALGLANIAYWRGWPQHLSRKVPHIAAAVPIAMAPLFFQDIWYPLGLCLAFLLLLLAGHRFGLFPGTIQRGRFSELGFPLALLAPIALFWNVNPWIAVLPGLGVAIGDAVAGLVRFFLYRRQVKGWWGSAACFGTIAAMAILIVTPLWLGLVAALAGTLAERYSGDSQGAILYLDDNLTLPLAMTVVLLGVLL